MLGSLPGSRSVPGCCPAGRGAGKVPVRPGGSGHFCRDAHRDTVRGPCRAREGRGLAQGSPPGCAHTSRNHEQVSGWPQPLHGSLLVPQLISHRCHLAARAAAWLCHVAHTDGLPAPLIWVIRVYVLTGINTKVAVTGAYFQAQRTAGRCAGKMPQQRPGHAPRLGAGWGVPPDRACPAPGRLLTPLLHLQCSEPQAAASRVNRGFLGRWTCSVKHNSSTSSAVS